VLKINRVNLIKIAIVAKHDPDFNQWRPQGLILGAADGLSLYAVK
jgi:hypothetical protein